MFSELCWSIFTWHQLSKPHQHQWDPWGCIALTWSWLCCRYPLDSATCSAPADFITCSWQELSCQWTAPWLWSPVLPRTSSIFRRRIVYWSKMRIVWGICASLLCISIPWRMLQTGWLFIHLVSLDIWDISTQTLLRNCFLTWAFGFKHSYLGFTTCYDYNDTIWDTFLKTERYG